MSEIKELVDRVIEDGVLTEEEYEKFIDAVHADGEIDEAEGEQITRIFQLIQEGKLRVINSEREASEERKKKELQKKLDDL